MCLNSNINKIIIVLLIIIMITAVLLSLISCNEYRNFEKYHITYENFDFYDIPSIRFALIKSREELDKYFEQPEYIVKGENYEKDVEKFDDTFFDKYVLIAVDAYMDADIIVKKDRAAIKIVYKVNSRITDFPLPYLGFLSVSKKFVGDRTSIVSEIKHVNH